LGGWPGLLLSFFVLHHKVSYRKRSFQIKIFFAILASFLLKQFSLDVFRQIDKGLIALFGKGEGEVKDL